MKNCCAIFVFLILCSSNIVSSQTSWADGVTPQTSYCGTGCITFTTPFQEVVWPQGQTFRSFHYFWNFGDGQYTSGIYTIPTGQSTGTQVLSHNYTTSNLHEAYLEVVPVYDDDDEPDMIPVDIILNGISPTASSPPYMPTPGVDIDLIPLLSPRAGDTSTYILSIHSSCPETISGVTVDLAFDLQYAQIKNTLGNKLMPVTQNEYNDANTLNGNIQLQFSSIDPGERTNAFVQFFYKSNLMSGDEVSFSAALNNTSAPQCFTNPVTISDRLLAVKSHDPNIIIASHEEICLEPNNPSSIEYEIVFQNIGNNIASNVLVTNIIPDVFDLNSITVTKPAGIQTAGTPFFEVNTTTRKVKWLLDNAYLKKQMPSRNGKLNGTGQTGYGTTILDYHTIDTIAYTLNFDSSKELQPCGAIVNQATILFDNNAPIITNVFSTSIACDSLCTPCVTNKEIILLDTVEIPENGTAKIKLPKQADTKQAKWYPSMGLDNNKALTPSSQPSEVSYYTATVSDSCVQQQYQVPVKKVKEKGCNNEVICAILLAILLCILLYVFKRKSK